MKKLPEPAGGPAGRYIVVLINLLVLHNYVTDKDCYK